MKQFVYKIKTDNIQKNEYNRDGLFVIDSFISLIKYSYILFRFFTLFDFAICIFKVLSGKRKLVIIFMDNKVVSYCWLNLGFCKHYSVSFKSVVVGPVWTNTEYRRKGLATRLLKASLWYITANNYYESIYIDTSENNFAMQSVIQKCDFGNPKFNYPIND